MLLGIAQLVVNVPDLGPLSAELVAAGYAESFREEKLDNHPAKAELQRWPRERLAMVHFAASGRIAIELTAYEGQPPGGAAAYELNLSDPSCVYAAAAPGSLEFWRDGFGFRQADENRLAYRSLRPEWSVEVEMRDAPFAAEATTVDADGCVLLTVLTTSLDADLEQLEEQGVLVDSTAPWRELIGGRPVRVAFVRGPGGELVELLEPPRNKS